LERCRKRLDVNKWRADDDYRQVIKRGTMTMMRVLRTRKEGGYKKKGAELFILGQKKISF